MAASPHAPKLLLIILWITPVFMPTCSSYHGYPASVAGIPPVGGDPKPMVWNWKAKPSDRVVLLPNSPRR